MATLSSLVVSLSLAAEDFNNGLRNAQREAKEFANQISPMSKALSDVGRVATTAGAALTAGLTAPLVAVGVMATKAGIEFESSFAGVRKTVDGTEQDFERLASGLRGMAKEIPTSVNALNSVAEAAGQLGIKKEDILAFTRTMADLGVTTNLTADEAATATAQIQNIFGAAGQDVDRFGATLVALGNAGASTEKDIINMGLRIAGAGNQIGLSQAQVLSFASALSSVGINAEAGGSAISRVFLKMNDAVMDGGEALNQFAQIAGTSAAQFKKDFETDAASATVAFISGIQRMKDEGKNVNATLEELVGKNIILKDTLLRVAGAGGLLSEQLDIGNKAWQANTALVKEAEERYKTTESQLAILQNKLTDVGITLFEAIGPVLRDVIVPAFESFVDTLKTVADAFTGLPTKVQGLIIGLGAVAAAIGPVLAGFGLMVSGISGLIAPISSLLLTLTGTTGIVAALTAIAGPAGIAVAAIAAVSSAAYLVYQNWNTIGPQVIGIWDEIKDGAERIWNAIANAASEVTGAVAAVWLRYGDDIKAAWSAIWGGISDVVSVQWERISDLVTTGIRLISTVISEGLNVLVGVAQVGLGLFTGNWSLAWEGLKNIVSGVWNGISGIVTEIFRFSLTEISRFIDAVAKAAGGIAAKLPGVLGAPLQAIASGLNSASASVDGWVSSLDRSRTASTAFAASAQKVVGATEDAADATELFKNEMGKVVGVAGTATTAIGKLPPKLKDISHDSDDAAKKLNALVDKFNDSLRPADELNKELELLRAKFSDEQIIQVYGDRILKAAEAQREHGLAVSGAVAELEKAASGQELLGVTVDTTNVSLVEQTANFNELFNLLAKKPQISVYDESEKFLNETLPQVIDKALEVKTRIGGWADEAQRLNDKLKETKTTADILRTGGPPITIGPINEDLAAANTKLKEAVENIKNGKGESDKFAEAWSTAFGNLAADFASALTDIITGAKSWKDAIVGIAKEAGKGFLDSFFLELTRPLQEMFSNWGKIVADKVRSIFSGIFGGGSNLLPDFGGGAAGAAGSAGGGGGLSSVAGGGSPWMQVISGGISAIGSLIGSMRLEGTMNAVEFNTRATSINLEHTINQILWPMHGHTERIAEYTEPIKYLPPIIEATGYAIVSAVQGIEVTFESFGSLMRSGFSDMTASVRANTDTLRNTADAMQSTYTAADAFRDIASGMYYTPPPMTPMIQEPVMPALNPTGPRDYSQDRSLPDYTGMDPTGPPRPLVNVTVNGPIVGDSGVDQFALEIAQRINSHVEQGAARLVASEVI